MIHNIKYVISNEYNPYDNLAMEEYLLNRVEKNECILYLWQNEKTVVIGKNQNSWKECKINALEEDHGTLVRRLSGGGAVFHDLGNLNFTFLVNQEDYDVEKQLEVIIKAVRSLGIPAEKTGRNDITVDGRKFSGNAFYSNGTRCYHHGTILVNVDMQNLSKYLNVSRDKLISKGVESVKSRVINLNEYVTGLDIPMMKQELIKAFAEVYGCDPIQMDLANIDYTELNKLCGKFSSWDWIFGKKIEFNYSIGRRFEWGDIDIHLNIDSGIIKQCTVYSDAMDTKLIEEIPNNLINCLFSTDAMVKELNELSGKDHTLEKMINDIVKMLMEEGI